MGGCRCLQGSIAVVEERVVGLMLQYRDRIHCHGGGQIERAHFCHRPRRAMAYTMLSILDQSHKEYLYWLIP